MKKVVIYGVNQEAQQIAHLLMQEETAELCGFAVDAKYKKIDTLLGYPVFAFENLPVSCPPEDFEIILSFGYKNMLRNRQQKYENVLQLGYQMYTFISTRALVLTDQIGQGSIILPNTVIAPSVKIGKGCFIEMSCNLSHDVKVGDFCYFSPGVTTCGNIHIGNNCFFGASSLILNGLTVGDYGLVAAGAIVNKDVSNQQAVFAAKSYYEEKRNSTEIMERYF